MGVNPELLGTFELCVTVGLYVMALTWCIVLVAVSKRAR